MSEPETSLVAQIGAGIGALIAGAVLTVLGYRKGKAKNEDIAEARADGDGTVAEQLRMLLLRRELEKSSSEDRAKLYARIEQFSSALAEGIRVLNEDVQDLRVDVTWIQGKLAREGEQPPPRRQR